MKSVMLMSLGVIALLSAPGVQSVVAQETEVKVLEVGDKAPDFTVTTFGDESVTLSDRFGDEGHPVILLFSRANW